jgi:hypothetical protein
VRLWNASSKSVEEMLTFARGVARAWRVDLCEKRIEELRRDEPAGRPRGRADGEHSHEISIELGPHEIVTLEIELED